MIGIIVAMESEASAIYAKMSNVSVETIGGKRFTAGKLANKDVVVALAGIGKINASYTTTILIREFQPSFVINTGIAGGLGRVKPLGVVIGTSVVQHDMDTSPLGDPVGYISGVGVININCDEKLSNLLASGVEEPIRGVVACGDQFIADAKRVKEIVDTFDAIACDMESGAVAQVAYMSGVPFGIIRVISDDGGDDAQISYNDLCIKATEINSQVVMSAISQL